MHLKPRSILDLGIGNGKYGALLREYLDLNFGRKRPEDWSVKIHGFEAWQPYYNPMWQLYDGVFIEDFTSISTRDRMAGYDLVLMIDTLEHVDESVALSLLDELRTKNKWVIVACPDGNYAQGAMMGNKYEEHRSVWTMDRLVSVGGNPLFRGFCAVTLFRGKD